MTSPVSGKSDKRRHFSYEMVVVVLPRMGYLRPVCVCCVAHSSVICVNVISIAFKCPKNVVRFIQK